ncbi:polysaccharide export protein EpsE [Niveibacterium sp. COAC-50]|uniref:polysaccharide export protein EpsE n=1 Tax=Niveibacterium sp. COAC-50 TaxID=2729384 RepID=UPI0020A62CBB|nr:polysaccharide export protein EpsE [Niveibacterium sp. COAC-50]
MYSLRASISGVQRIVRLAALALFGFAMTGVNVWAATEQPAVEKGAEYLLGPGDVIRISVFQSPDLLLETRVSENGSISYPLIGNVKVGGLALSVAEAKIAKLLKDGGFVVQPQVSILLLQIRGNQVAVLGQVNRPGRYPLETANTRLSDMLSQAGGIAATGSDVVIFSGVRDGKQVRREIDIASMFLRGDAQDDLALKGGDILYVHRAPVFFIYGEVQRPGVFRVERDMTVMQALASGGGLTQKGTQRGLRIHRRGADGKAQIIEPALDELVQPNDVVYVKESIF